MSYITEKQIKPSKIDGNRHDTREPGIDHKKVGPELGNIRKPNLDPDKVEQLLEDKANLLRLKQEKLAKGKGSR